MGRETEDPRSGLRINLGASQTYLPGFVNVDIAEPADVTCDLGRDPLPFESGSSDLVFSHHTLEHVPDYLFALSEIFRVLKHDGMLLLQLPYVTLTEFNLVNPYHVHNFSENSFAFFDRTRLKGSASEENEMLFSEVFHRFYYIRAFGVLPAPLREWARRHIFNVVRAFDIALVAVKDPDVPVDLSMDRAKALETTFDELLAARTPYVAGGDWGGTSRRTGAQTWRADGPTAPSVHPAIQKIGKRARRHFEVRGR